MGHLLALILLAAPSNGTIGNDLTAGGTASATKVTSAGTVEGQRLTYPAPTTDAAPSPMTLKAPNVLHNATTNKTGANLLLSGGIGETDITIINKSTVGTLTFARTVDGVTPANVVWTAGTTWVCGAAASEAECATNLNTYCNANKPSGVCGCSNTTAGHVYVQWCDATTVGASVTSSDAAKMSVTQGNLGPVLFPVGSTTVPSVAFIGDPTSGFSINPTNHRLTYSVAGAYTFWWDAAGAYFGTTSNINPATGVGTFAGVASTGSITSSSATTIGWSVVTAAAAACTATCTNACVVGQKPDFTMVDCSDTAATRCLCAGAN